MENIRRVGGWWLCLAVLAFVMETGSAAAMAFTEFREGPSVIGEQAMTVTLSDGRQLQFANEARQSAVASRC